MIGPGKAIDTEKYFVVSSNNLGGCAGTTGPGSINPATGKPYNMRFPVITVEDTVRAHRLLLERLGVKRLRTVIGGSLAGMQTLEWGLRYGDFCDSVIPVAAAARLDPMGIAWGKIARRAITADAAWKSGDYAPGQGPRKGLSAARMLAHVTYLSRGIMWEKFGRETRDKDAMLADIASRFEVESYLDHQGEKFVDRFDANSYLYISRMMDLYDASLGFESLEASLSRLSAKCMLVCFISDWLFPPERSIEMAEALRKLGREVELHTVESTYGHDAFLVQYDKLTEIVGGFLERLERGGAIGIDATPVPPGMPPPRSLFSRRLGGQTRFVGTRREILVFRQRGEKRARRPLGLAGMRIPRRRGGNRARGGGTQRHGRLGRCGRARRHRPRSRRSGIKSGSAVRNIKIAFFSQTRKHKTETIR